MQAGRAPGFVPAIAGALGAFLSRVSTASTKPVARRAPVPSPRARVLTWTVLLAIALVIVVVVVLEAPT